jgi:hypothetical protein
LCSDAPPPKTPAWRDKLAWSGFATYALVTTFGFFATGALRWPAELLQPFRIGESYGLFAVMTRARYEIEFQGTVDGEHWVPYPFRFKPQDVNAAPGIYAPYQPRFEWDLWFASLEDVAEWPWVVTVEERLLAGEPSVLALFARDPFGGKRPASVRAVKWRYWFTTPAEKRATGAWWRREEIGPYAPAVP